MIFPFESLSDERRALGLAFAVVIGIAFGFVLERGGMGRGQKIVAQFYGRDMTVFKLMFTAVVTAMLGTVILSGVGLLDLRIVAFNYPTFLWPMIVGGLLVGAGLVISGYCPGTSVAAAGSGKIDGILTVVGVVIGSILYAETEPALHGFQNTGKLGPFFLSDLLHLPRAVVAAVIAVVAIAAFFGAEAIERRVNGQAAPTAPAPARRWVFIGVVALALVAAATLALPTVTSAAR